VVKIETNCFAVDFSPADQLFKYGTDTEDVSDCFECFHRTPVFKFVFSILPPKSLKFSL
jgi:hypothetical protein